MGPDGGVLSSSTVPMVQASFPQGALTKRIRVGLQVQQDSFDQLKFNLFHDSAFLLQILSTDVSFINT